MRSDIQAPVRHPVTRSTGRAVRFSSRVAAALGAASIVLAVLPAERTDAATGFTTTSLGAQVKGTSVAATVTIKASRATVVQKFKVCVRSSSGVNLDYPGKATISIKTGAGTSYAATKSFAVGNYTYWGCLKVGDVWRDVGARKSFVVKPAGLPTTMPTRSTRKGWAYSYGQDFNKNAPLGQFSKIYGRHWAGYTGTRNDTSRNGSYRPDAVLSVADGKLDLALGYDAGTGHYNVAAPFPQPPAGVNGGSAEYRGMRSSVRFRSSGPMPGYKVAWMLWPSTWNWKDGEIDFPEADLDGPIWGFSHQANTGNPHINAMWAQSGTTFHEGGWHVATTEWVPGKSVEFFLDGVSVGRTTRHVPTKPMHWTLQTETALRAAPPARTTRGHISIDWLTVESYAPAKR